MSVDRDGDGLYDNNLECVWVIVAPNTTLMELVFSSMEIEWHKNCESDYVRVKPIIVFSMFTQKTKLHLEYLLIKLVFSVFSLGESKKDGKDQETIQSSTTPDQ